MACFLKALAVLSIQCSVVSARRLLRQRDSDSCFTSDSKWVFGLLEGEKPSAEPDAASCQKRCQAADGCTRFTFKTNGNCLLHTQKAEFGEEKGTVSGPKFCQSAVTCLRSDVSYLPLDMDGTNTTVEDNAAMCQLRCRTVNGCATFVMLAGGKCHLQGSMSVPVEAKGAVSGPPSCTKPDATTTPKPSNLLPAAADAVAALAQAVNDAKAQVQSLQNQVAAASSAQTAFTRATSVAEEKAQKAAAALQAQASLASAQTDNLKQMSSDAQASAQGQLAKLQAQVSSASLQEQNIKASADAAVKQLTEKVAEAKAEEDRLRSLSEQARAASHEAQLAAAEAKAAAKAAGESVSEARGLAKAAGESVSEAKGHAKAAGESVSEAKGHAQAAATAAAEAHLAAAAPAGPPPGPAPAVAEPPAPAAAAPPAPASAVGLPEGAAPSPAVEPPAPAPAVAAV